MQQTATQRLTAFTPLLIPLEHLATRGRRSNRRVKRHLRVVKSHAPRSSMVSISKYGVMLLNTVNLMVSFQKSIIYRLLRITHSSDIDISRHERSFEKISQCHHCHIYSDFLNLEA